MKTIYSIAKKQGYLITWAAYQTISHEVRMSILQPRNKIQLAKENKTQPDRGEKVIERKMSSLVQKYSQCMFTIIYDFYVLNMLQFCLLVICIEVLCNFTIIKPISNFLSVYLCIKQIFHFLHYTKSTVACKLNQRGR